MVRRKERESRGEKITQRRKLSARLVATQTEALIVVRPAPSPPERTLFALGIAKAATTLTPSQMETRIGRKKLGFSIGGVR